MNAEGKYSKYSRYGSLAVSIGGFIMVCSFMYFIVLQKRTADAQKKSSDSVIRTLRQVLYQDSVNLSLRSVLSLQLNENNVKDYPVDTRLLTKSSIMAAEAITPANNVNGHFAIFLGQTAGKKWDILNFQFPYLPWPGSFVPLTATMYERNAVPIKLNNRKWQLGDIIGAVNSGTLLKIDSVKNIDGKNYWAFAELNDWLVVLNGSPILKQAQQIFNSYNAANIATIIIFRNNSYRNVSQPFKNKADATYFLTKNKGMVAANAYIVKLSSWAPKLGYNGFFYTDYNTVVPQIFKTDFIRTNIEFTFNGDFIPDLDGTIVDKRNTDVQQNPNAQFRKINDKTRNLNWTAYLAEGQYKIVLKDSKYKIMRNKSGFSFTKSEVNIGYTTKIIPLELK